MRKGIGTTFFRETLEKGDERAVRRALEHLIGWHEIYGTQMFMEYGIEANGDGAIYPCTELYAKGMENQPGITVHQRKVTRWEPKSKYPVPELTRGAQVDIYPNTPLEP